MDTNSPLQLIWEKKLLFIALFFLVFTISYLILVAIDFVPEEPTDEPAAPADSALVEDKETATDNDVVTDDQSAFEVAETPLSLHIKRLGRTIQVLNPTSRTIADLDRALLDGVVRHPDSALLGQTGNVFILGHSSYLPTVFNANFKAFNGIQDLKWGDVIEVSSADQVFVYRVEKVFQARAQDLTVPIAVDEKKLTLATCNSFGSVDDRYIVEARQIEVRTL